MLSFYERQPILVGNHPEFTKLIRPMERWWKCKWTTWNGWKWNTLYNSTLVFDFSVIRIVYLVRNVMYIQHDFETKCYVLSMIWGTPHGVLKTRAHMLAQDWNGGKISSDSDVFEHIKKLKYLKKSDDNEWITDQISSAERNKQLENKELIISNRKDRIWNLPTNQKWMWYIGRRDQTREWRDDF